MNNRRCYTRFTLCIYFGLYLLTEYILFNISIAYFGKGEVLVS